MTSVICYCFSSWWRRGPEWCSYLLWELSHIQELWWSAWHSLSNTTTQGWSHLFDVSMLALSSCY